MKINFAVLATALLASSLAASYSAHADEDVCAVWYDLGKTVMANYQAGVPMPDMMRTTRDIPSESTRDLMVDIIQIAYDSPKYIYEANQQEAVSEFANALAAKCYRAVGSLE